MNPTASQASRHWEREFILTSEWLEKLPSIKQLQERFSLTVIQSIDPLSPNRESSFLLAHSTQCHNGSRTINGLVNLSPNFSSLPQLEAHVSAHAIDILHSLFYGQQTAQHS